MFFPRIQVELQTAVSHARACRLATCTHSHFFRLFHLKSEPIACQQAKRRKQELISEVFCYQWANKDKALCGQNIKPLGAISNPAPQEIECIVLECISHRLWLPHAKLLSVVTPKAIELKARQMRAFIQAQPLLWGGNHESVRQNSAH